MSSFEKPINKFKPLLIAPITLSFTITFEDAIKVDVDTLVEDAYELIKEQASEICSKCKCV